MPTKLHEIPIRVESSNGQLSPKSGDKYVTGEGVNAVKDGVKKGFRDENANTLRKPEWLRISLNTTPKYEKVKALVHENRLSTVCEEAKCPNMSECWSHGTATIMLMGSVCTRACRFCSVDTGNPKGWLDLKEPEKTAETVKIMDLDYVVLTSVDRDDLPDGGAAHYAKTIALIKSMSPKTKVEALTPDFQGHYSAIDTLLAAKLDVFAQNVETVERLTHPVRDIRASYHQTIDLLRYSKVTDSRVLTKTSLMLGLGETEAELLKTMDDLREAKVDILTLGQYLQPTKNHLPIVEFVHPDDFKRYREIGLEKGFYEVASGPMVRSSYRAERVFQKDNLGL
jgi:lipoic acid synthetase